MCLRVNDARSDGNVVWCVRYFGIVCSFRKKSVPHIFGGNLIGGGEVGDHCQSPVQCSLRLRGCVCHKSRFQCGSRRT